MAGAIMDKIWGVIGMNNNQSEAEEPENDDYEVDTYDNYEEEEEDRKFFGRKGKVVPISQAQQVKMVISQPTTFEQSEEICSLLKEKKSVIVNLEYVRFRIC